MEIFKPDKANITPDCLDIEDDFYNHSHGTGVDTEFTLCGYAIEEWNHTKKFPKKEFHVHIVLK